MEKENTNKTNSEETAKAAAGGTSCYEWCMSCLGGKEIPGQVPAKWKDFCKEMPDQQRMDEMMRMFFQGDKKTG
jgi:hypothetical protein